MADDHGQALEKTEERAARDLSAELSEHQDFGLKVWALIVRVLGEFKDDDPNRMASARKACLVLMTRLANDLRCAALLAERGYSDQAVILAASIFEIAHTICYIQNNEDRAEAWIAHRRPSRNFKPIRELIRATADLVDATNKEKFVRNEQLIYAQLCWPKHASPFFLGLRLPEERSQHGNFFLGPEITDLSIRRAWFALEHSGRLGLLAVDVFQNLHATVLDVARVMETCRVMLAELSTRANERWGTEDPFKGEW